MILSIFLITETLFAQTEKQSAKNKINLGDMVISESGKVGIGIENPSSTLEIKGELRLTGNTGYVGFAPSNETRSTTYTLPTQDGNVGDFLQTNGSGDLSWEPFKPYRSSCPQGFSLLGTPDTPEALCISTNQEATASWLKSIENCYNKSTKAHLCSASEWAMACISKLPQKMTGHWEWVADSGSNYGRIIGFAGCDSFNGAAVDASYPSRCCFR